MSPCADAGITKCALPCEHVEYSGNFIQANGMYNIANANDIVILFQFNTMDTEVHTEILTFDFATFIGTAGGSLGLFLGFSLTGFADQVLNFFMRN